MARRDRDPALAQGVLDPGDLHAKAGRGPVPVSAPRARLGLRLRESLQRRRLLHPSPASQDRPAVWGRDHRDRARRRLSPTRGDALSRLPIRLRVTLVFAGIMAIVLAGTGLFLRLRLESSLDQSIDRDLRSRT